MTFAQGVVGAADPDDLSGCGLSAIMLTAVLTHQQATERVGSRLVTAIVILLRTALQFLLYLLKGLSVNDSLMGILNHVLG